MDAMKLFFLTLVVLVGFSGCAEDPPAPDPVAEAKACIEAADYECAVNHYKSITANEGTQLYAEKTVGLALVEWAQWFESVGSTVVELASLIAETANEDQSPQYRPSASVVNSIVYRTLSPTLSQVQRVEDALSEAATANITQQVHFDAFPLLVGDVPLTVLSGDFAAPDLHLFESWMHGTAGVLAVLLAVDLEFPVGPTVRYGLSLDECDSNANANQARDCAERIIAFFVNNGENFLGREPTRGKEYQAMAAEELASFYASSSAMFDALQSEQDPSSQRFLRWEDRPDGGGWITARLGDVALDENDVRAILTNELYLEAPYEFETREVRFVTTGEVLENIDDTVKHLRDGTNSYVPASSSVISSLLTASEVFLQSDVLIHMTQVVISAIDQDLAQSMAQIARRVQELYSDFGTADAVHNLLRYLFPESLEVNHNAVLRSEAMFRNAMPAAVSDGTFEEFPTWQWRIERECDDQDRALLGCARDATLTDSAHFVGTQYELAADGRESVIGYVAFDDASLGGLIRFDPSEVDAQFAEGVRSPNLLELNEMIQSVGGLLNLRLFD